MSDSKDRVKNPNGISIIAFVFGVLFFVLPMDVFSQDNRLINTKSWQYDYIKQLQQRGYLLDLSPTHLPYVTKDLRKALNKVNAKSLNRLEKRWVELLKNSVAERLPNVDSMRVGGLFEGGARHSSSDRLNLDDPKGEGEPILTRGKLNGYFEWKNWIGQAGITHDLFYDLDPDGLDTARRLYIRSEGTYFGYNSHIFDIYVGRFDNHWSVYDRQGGYLTDNPRSFDQLQLKFGTSKLSFSSILGELDNLGANGTFSGIGYRSGAIQRYLFLHRLDWSPKKNLKLSVFEGEIYYSESAGISLRNLIPLHFLYFSTHNKPRNVNTNLVLGGGVWYNYKSFTFSSQLMIDEITLANREEKKEANRFLPATYTLNSSIHIADIAEAFDFGIESDLVSANSYRSGSFEDQWSYAQRGLATNFSDYIRTKAYMTFYPGWLEGLKIEPSVTSYLKGTEDLRDLRKFTEPDGSQIPGILAGTVERTWRPSLYLRYQPMGTNLFGPSNDVRFNFWLDADMGVNFTDNYQNIEGATNRRFIGLFQLFGQFTF